MAKLVDLKQSAQVKEIDPTASVSVIDVKWFGPDIVELTYRDQKGQPHTELLYRDREADIEVVDAEISWSFDSDGELFRLVSEAYASVWHVFLTPGWQFTFPWWNLYRTKYQRFMAKCCFVSP